MRQAQPKDNRFALNALRRTDRNSATPLYRQIYLVLREKIEAGEGQRLPGEAELCDIFGVSRITIRRALSELESDRLIIRMQGAGTFARAPVPVKAVSGSMADYLEYRQGIAEISDARVISAGWVKPPVAVQEAMGCGENTKLHMSVRIRSFRSTPFLHLTVYTVPEIGRHYSRKQLRTESLLSLLQQFVRVSSAEQIVSATSASPGIAELLEVEIGAPLIKVNYVISDEQGRIVEYVTSLARPDLYQMRNTLQFDAAASDTVRRRR
jgi:GntR family transcriptional regulator